MSDQLCFFASARKSDPATSHQANHIEARVYRATIRDRLLLAYFAKPSGLTDEEASSAARVERGGWKRCSELRRLGLIKPNGQARRSSAGENGRVCVITNAGRLIAVGLKEKEND